MECWNAGHRRLHRRGAEDAEQTISKIFSGLCELRASVVNTFRKTGITRKVEEIRETGNGVLE
jgi:hypothetical protein